MIELALNTYPIYILELLTSVYTVHGSHNQESTCLFLCHTLLHEAFPVDLEKVVPILRTGDIYDSVYRLRNEI